MEVGGSLKRIRRADPNEDDSLSNIALEDCKFEFEKEAGKFYFSKSKRENGNFFMVCKYCNWKNAYHPTRARIHIYGEDADGNRFPNLRCKKLEAQPPQRKLDNVVRSMAANEALLDLLITFSIPFSVLDSDQFKNFAKLMLESDPRTKIISATQAKTMTLNRMAAQTSRIFEEIRGAGVASWGLSLISDGREFYSKSVINYYAVMPGGRWRLGTKLKNGAIASSMAVASDLGEHINKLNEALGHPAVAHVILDGTHTNKKALMLLTLRPELYKNNVFVQVCSAHGFSKLAEKLSILGEFNQIKESAHAVIKLIKNRDRLRTALLEAQSVPSQAGLIGFCATRFAYVIIALERLFRFKYPIKAIVSFAT